jgi:hypothetical protein
MRAVAKANRNRRRIHVRSRETKESPFIESSSSEAYETMERDARHDDWCARMDAFDEAMARSEELMWDAYESGSRATARMAAKVGLRALCY